MPNFQKSRVVTWIEKAKNHPVILIIVSLAAILTFILTILGQAQSIYKWYFNKFTYASEYDKLEKIRLGVSPLKVNEIFGTPTSTRKLCTSEIVSCPERLKGKFRIDFYKHKAYYLRVISNDEQVVFYSITSRNADFKPEITTIFSDKVKRLSEATFADLLPPSDGPDQFDMFIGMSGVVAYWEVTELGRPGDYQAYYFGYSSAGYSGYEFSFDNASELQSIMYNDTIDTSSKGQILDKFRSNSKPNTYGFFEDSSKNNSSGDFGDLMKSEDLFLWRDLPLYEGVDD